MDGKMLTRLGAIIFVAIAITATAIEMTRKEDAPASSPRLVQPERDPLREGQRRCQQLGTTAANDAECLAVWAESRDRFLGRSPAPAAPSSSEGR
ncbi:putative entry exclusion protein TrbK-alt [Brucella pseudogrignonensis]|jgi:conjugative transfer region protein TrbK|uniref:Putative conjugal transfer protein TrbK n=1 Tax=Brucella pseudogrignonensis TaxID=419475 RepID=A0A256G367_9HYPH|nr:putative entry exclusion protein TrbK-alt [Brucella pseudogrignonensis]NKX16701.1 putative entry exclusion protein TrbK-alt [Brucella pseudogrignonensis]OYR21519.1 putative conjugal transfer protein TrbK [Brucella pseudogrignonensis]